MKTRFLSLGLIFIMIISLAGCSGNTEEAEISEETDVFDEEETEEVEEAEITEDVSASDAAIAINFESANIYSEGLAWIEFSLDTDENVYYGVINKAGELIFSLSSAEATSGEEFIGDIINFSNGYSYVIYQYYNTSGIVSAKDSRYVIVNTEGEVTAEYYADDYDEVFYSEGYFLGVEYSADYYSEIYTYTIYSPEGEVLWTYESEEECSVNYDPDSGVYTIEDQEYTVEIADYNEYPETSDQERTVKISEGADGNNYIILYDNSGNQVSEPIQVVFSNTYSSNYYNYSGSRLIIDILKSNSVPATINDVYIYDENGNYIYALSEVGYTGISCYSDGAALVTNYEHDEGINKTTESYMYNMKIADGEEPVYLDLNGDPLFDSIDMSAFYELYE